MGSADHAVHGRAGSSTAQALQQSATGLILGISDHGGM